MMIIAAMVVTLLFCVTGAQAETVVIQDGLIVNDAAYWAAEDTKLHGGAPDTNFSIDTFTTAAEAYWRSTPYWRGYPEHTLMKFAGLDFLSGRYASIDSVTLTLYSTSILYPKEADLYIQQVAGSNSWDQTTATWNNNGASPWTSGVAGLEGEGDTIGTISTLHIPTVAESYTFDLDPAAIVSWIEGGFDNPGMIIRPDVVATPNPGTTTDAINTWAENKGTQALRPKLTINYTTPEPQPMPAARFKLRWWDGFWNSDGAYRMGDTGASGAVCQNDIRSSAEVLNWLDKAQLNGLPTMVGIALSLVDAGDTTAISAYVEDLDDHPAVDGWFLYDSPAGDAPTLAKLNAAYTAIKAADPDHRVSIGFWAGTATYSYLQSSYDHILAYSYNCMADTSEFNLTDINTFKSNMDNTSSAATALGKSWGAVLQAFGREPGEETRRLPTFNEARFMLYYATAKGAESVTFYPLYRTEQAPAYPGDPYPLGGVQWKTDVFSELATEIDTLGNAIEAGTVAGLSDDSADVLADLYQDSDTDEYYLVALNSMLGSENPTFTLTIPNVTHAQLLFEGAEWIPVVGGQFADVFDDYEAHVYKLIILLQGDANHDGVVSAGDYASVQANFGNVGIGIEGDANGDGVVSAGDYASVQANFGNVAPTVQATPEPATMSLLVLGGLAMLKRRK